MKEVLVPRWVSGVYSGAAEMLRLNLECELESRAALAASAGEKDEARALAFRAALAGRVAEMDRTFRGCAETFDIRREELGEAQALTMGLFLASVWLVLQQRTATLHVVESMIAASRSGAPDAIPFGWEVALTLLGGDEPLEAVVARFTAGAGAAVRTPAEEAEVAGGLARSN